MLLYVEQQQILCVFKTEGTSAAEVDITVLSSGLNA